MKIGLLIFLAGWLLVQLGPPPAALLGKLLLGIGVGWTGAWIQDKWSSRK